MQTSDQREQAVRNCEMTNPTDQSLSAIAQDPTSPYNGNLQESQITDWLPNAFDPRQSVQPILPSDSFGLQGCQTPVTFPNAFDPRQSVQPILSSDSFGLQGGQTPDTFPNAFDPRQCVQPILSSDSFGMQEGQVTGGIQNSSEMPPTSFESGGSGQYTRRSAPNPRKCIQIQERADIQEPVYNTLESAAINCA